MFIYCVYATCILHFTYHNTLGYRGTPKICGQYINIHTVSLIFNALQAVSKPCTVKTHT